MINKEEQQYLDVLQELLDAPSKGDRTGTGTRALFCRQMRFDLSKSFPLLTTKKVFLKGVIAELLWFLSGSQNERDLCELTYGTRDPNKKTIWTDNCIDRAKLDPNRFNGTNMGNMYNIAWRKLPCNPHGYRIIKRKSYKDDYIENGIGEIFIPNVQGHGYIGGEYPRSELEKKLYRVWQDMLIRVYNPRKNHNAYGKVKVCKRWLNFNNFYNDCFNLTGYQEFVDSGFKYQLDKDYYGSEIYSPDTCIFINPSLNKSLNGGGYGFKIYKYDGKTFHRRSDLQAYRGLSRRANLPKDIEIIEDNEEFVVRPIIYIDQIQNMIDTIKNDPNSRRIIVDAWNPRNIDNAVLGVCHPLFQVQILNGKLNLVFMMRSSDTFLGLPFNIASYAILTHLLAYHTGYEVGELVYEGHDVHLYDNHVEQAKLQLSREAYPFPQLKINYKESIFDYTLEDFEIVGYQSHAAIKAPIAV